MKKLLFLLSLMLIATLTLQADEQLREVQQSLKDQGFYYGQVDGQPGGETNAAIRRYQIRNGIDVTGQINRQTLDSLKIGNTPAPQKTAPVQPPPPPPKTTSAPHPPQREPVESDREFLRKHSPPKTTLPPEYIPPPQPAPLAPDYAYIFRKTPYESAPREVQMGTLRRAQERLFRDGFYNGQVDGIPGPSTERAILKYQSDANLQPTGRLDMNTLADMRLLPDRRPVRFFPTQSPPPPERRVYRGIWIQ